jgi:hypothetical protein
MKKLRIASTLLIVIALSLGMAVQITAVHEYPNFERRVGDGYVAYITKTVVQFYCIEDFISNIGREGHIPIPCECSHGYNLFDMTREEILERFGNVEISSEEEIVEPEPFQAFPCCPGGWFHDRTTVQCWRLGGICWEHIYTVTRSCTGCGRVLEVHTRRGPGCGR